MHLVITTTLCQTMAAPLLIIEDGTQQQTLVSPGAYTVNLTPFLPEPGFNKGLMGLSS